MSLPLTPWPFMDPKAVQGINDKRISVWKVVHESWAWRVRDAERDRGFACLVERYAGRTHASP